MKFYYLVTVFILSILAFPAMAQKAEPLMPEAETRAFTLRAFVEPDMLRQLGVGDEVLFYNTYFTARNYPHAEGFEDTYVVAGVAGNLRFMAADVVHGEPSNAPLVEAVIRVEGQYADIMDIAMSDFYHKEVGDYIKITPRSYSIVESINLFASDTIVMAMNEKDLPVFCEACETLALWDYIDRAIKNPPFCYSRLRRGVDVALVEIPCRDN